MSDEEDHVEVTLDKAEDAVKDEPEIEIVDEKPKKEPEVEKAQIIEPEEGIQELKKRLEAEKYARLEAEKRAREASVKAERANDYAKDANYQLVVNAIETVKERSETLKVAHKEAMSVGDYDKVAEIQEAMSINAYQLNELKRGEQAMKEQQQAAEEAARRQPVRPIDPPADMIEQMAQNVSPRSASWLRSNKESLSGEREIRKMLRAHEDAIDDGIAADTDEYFSFIESRLGFRKHQEEQESALSTAAAPAPRRSTQPPPAPVSRSNQRSNVVRLTREQADTAKMLGMSDKEYAQHMIALREEGKLGN
jgi:hypothetical protein